jgi:signal transduction histidine kinase
MILKRVHFPIFILALLLIFTIFSCKKQQAVSKKSKIDTAYNANINRAEKYFASNQYDSALYYYTKIKSNSDTNKESEKIIYSLLKIATIQQIQTDYTGSESTATESISLFKKSTDSYYKVAIFNLLGINYKNIFDYDNAIAYYKKAINLSQDKFQKAIIQNNIAVIYMDKQNYKKAIQILYSLSLRKEIIENQEQYSRTLDNLGYCYFKISNPKSLEYLNKALSIRKQLNYDYGMTTSYLNFSEFHKNSNPKLAYNYAHLAYEKATKINSVDTQLKSLAMLIQNSNGNLTKKYSETYLRINDSINKVRQKAKNQFAKIKYDSKKEREENLILKTQKAENALQLEKEKNRNLLLLLCIAMGISGTVFIIYFLNVRNKREKIKSTYDTETRISKKLHDELANDVYHTMAFAETQNLASSQNKEQLLNHLETIYTRTRNISKENSSIETGIHFLSHLKEMMASFNTDEVNILVNGLDTFNWDLLENNKKITVYRVVQELLVNMKKHSKCSLVVLNFKKNEKKLQVDYSDNGLGADFDKINLKNGLQNVENRILSIKGTITFDIKSEKGFKVSFIFPI